MKPIYILATIPSALLPAAGLGVGEGASEYAEEVVERSVEFQPGGRLSLVNVNGEISVGTWDRHEVTMKAEKRAGAGSEEEARLLLEETTVEFDRIEDRIDIRTELPKRNRERNVTVAYTLTVPEEIAPGVEIGQWRHTGQRCFRLGRREDDQRPHRACRDNRGGYSKDNQRPYRAFRNNRGGQRQNHQRQESISRRFSDRSRPMRPTEASRWRFPNSASRRMISLPRPQTAASRFRCPEG